MPKMDPARLTKVTVNLPFGLGGGEWESDPTERRAAWALYVELVTRVATQPVALEEGLLSGVLSSLYGLFDSTRKILEDAGPEVGAASDSVDGIAIVVLNRGLRPFLTRWYSDVEDWMQGRPAGTTRRCHERAWPERQRFWAELETLRGELELYAKALAAIAGVDWLSWGTPAGRRRIA